MTSSGSLISREYKDFRGVDFNVGEISTKRSPFSLNMWKNYKDNAKCIETRPDLDLVQTFDNTIYSRFEYTKNNTIHNITHSGVKLYDGDTEIYTGMNVGRSQYFVFKDILYIKDGLNYLKYDGTTVTSVEGYIPTTTMSKKPSGAGATLEDVNLLTGKRKNSFVADGTSTEYKLDAENIDSDFVVTAEVNGTTILEGQGLSVDVTKGIVTFATAPEAPITAGQDNVIITFSKTISENRNKVLRCNLLTEFDNRIFFSGNPNYPNVLFHSSLNNPEYISDLDVYVDGDIAPIKAMVAGNNALWVLKAPSQGNTSIFYHNPVIDANYGKVYPSVHSSISTGCVSTGINFNDDIVFFSNRGMEGISSNVTTEQVIGHRSSMVDAKLLEETNYKNLMLEEWQGYLLVIIDNKIYLADSRAKFQNVSVEYEWFYWEFDKPISTTYVKNDILYLGIDNKVYSLTNKTNNVNSVWQIGKEDFNAPQLLKTTNKRGGTANCEGEIQVRIKADNKSWKDVAKLTATKGYIVYRIKEKKFKDIMLEFKSNKPMKLYNVTIECFIGGYIKR